MPRSIVIPKVSVDLGDLGDFTDALAAKAEVIHSHAATDVSDSTVIGRTILTAADAAAVKTALSLPSFGGAASLAVGTTTGTVAAGDDSRITGAAQKSANLSDVSSASSARTNLGLGAAAVLNVGTSTGTVAAGDDSRITGAAQKSSNLSDLASASTARTNLGLGGAAVLAVGTTAGTVMAGDDSRVTTASADAAAAAGGESSVTVVAATGASREITGAIGRYTMDQSCAFSLPAPTKAGAVRVAIISGAHSPTFPGVKWPDSGAAPTYTTPAVYTFVTGDTGATWYGFHGGSAFA